MTSTFEPLLSDADAGKLLGLHPNGIGGIGLLNSTAGLMYTPPASRPRKGFNENP